MPLIYVSTAVFLEEVTDVQPVKHTASQFRVVARLACGEHHTFVATLTELERHRESLHEHRPDLEAVIWPPVPA